MPDFDAAAAALHAAADALTASPGQDPPDAPGELAPPIGFSATWDPGTRRITCHWTSAPGAVQVQVHERDTDPAATLKDVLPASAGERISSELRGGHTYTWALRGVGAGGQLSAFTEWRRLDVPAADEGGPGQPDDDEDQDDEQDDDGQPQPGGPHPDEVLPVLKHWTIMLPTGTPGDPDNEYIVGKSIPDTYFVREDEHGRGVVFRTYPATANHSKNSKYGRTEGAQMVPGERWKREPWPSGSADDPAEPQHLHARMAIDASRLAHRRVNGAQIHDGGDDVMQVQSREGVLGIAHKDGKAWEVLDPAYVDGAVFVVDIRTTGRGELVIDYDGAEAVRIEKSGSGWYWKAGCYPNTGGANAERPESPDAAAEVIIYELDVVPA